MQICLNLGLPGWMCGLGLAQSGSGIRHPGQINLRVKRYSDSYAFC